jgi:CheY-like chemotaxis protein
MNCPRCKAVIGALADPESIVTCPGCGARLMTRAAALRSQGGVKPLAGQPGPSVTEAAPAPPPPAPPMEPAELPPSATLPGVPAVQLGTRPPPRAGEDTARGTGSRRKGKTEPRETEPARVDSAMVEVLLGELRLVREIQQQILDLLTGASRPSPSSHGPAGADHEDGLSLSPIRTLRQKTVLLVDDDPQTREAAVAELQQANVPVLACEDASTALQAIAEEKPDAIALELALGGEMAGKDVINLIKATMEWVDIPLILWTREPVANQREARQVHGADELVPKSAGPAALVTRVITLFRKG